MWKSRIRAFRGVKRSIHHAFAFVWGESQAKKGVKGSREDKAKAGFIGGTASKGGGRPDKKALLQQVLEMKERGCTNRDISEMLGISSGSVSNWLRSLKSW